MLQRLKRRWCIYLCVFVPPMLLKVITFSNAWVQALKVFAGFGWIILSIAPAYILARWAWPDPTPPPTHKKSTRREAINLAGFLAGFSPMWLHAYPKGVAPDVPLAVIILGVMIAFTINELWDTRDETPKAD